MSVRRWLIAVLVLTTSGAVFGQIAADRETLAKIRTEGMEHSQAVAVFDTLTTTIGPRLTASPAQKRASEYVRDRLSAYGVSNVHLEPWRFGRGWTLEGLTVEMIEPRYLPLIAYADGWSAATAGEIVAVPVFVGGKTAEQIQAMSAQLKGAIVMTQPLLSNFVRKDRPQPSDPDYVPMSAAYATSTGRGQAAPAAGPGAGRQGQAAPGASAVPPGRGSTASSVQTVLRDAGAAVLLKPSTGEFGTVFVLGRDQGPGAVPSLTMSAEHYNMIARMLERNVPVKLRVSVKTKFYDDEGGNAYNVIAELPGEDRAVGDEVIMIGAHIDCWHTGVGATDNADGVATIVEAMRILKAVGARPKRTIRVGIWSGEEQGLLGSRAWVAEHLAGDANKAARDKFNVYFNIDNGFGPVFGFYEENSEAAAQLFDRWLQPLKAVGARRNVFEGVGSTDHVSFRDVGVPGFNPIQRYDNYDVHTHHTNMDTVERLDPKELAEAATVMATFAFNAANSDRKFPRPPVSR
jgi:carboxypeptidase Q